MGIYNASTPRSLQQETREILKANIITFIIFLVISFFFSQQRLSRIVLSLYFISSSLLLIVARIVFESFKARLVKSVVLIGSEPETLKFYEKISRIKSLNIKYWVDAPEFLKNQYPSLENLEPDQLEAEGITNIFISQNRLRDHQDFFEKLCNSMITLSSIPDISLSKIGYKIECFQGQPLIHINEVPYKPIHLILKRIFDFTSALALLICISPILLVISILIKLTSKGPVIYTQKRTGIDGKDFKIYKFRTMITGDMNKETWTVKDDPRVTKLGSLLRKTNLDELPQLWNIIKGEMSVVGPRPERPHFVAEFRKSIPNYMIRHKFKSGLTGWAQIQGWRGDTSIKKRIECDLWYIKNWSLFLDLKIIMLTFVNINKNAY